MRTFSTQPGQRRSGLGTTVHEWPGQRPELNPVPGETWKWQTAGVDIVHSSMTEKRLMHLGLMIVHGDVLDSLDIGSPMRSFISANPEGKATFGVVCEAPKPSPLPVLRNAAQHTVASAPPLHGQQLLPIVYRWQGDQQHGRFYGCACSGSFM